MCLDPGERKTEMHTAESEKPAEMSPMRSSTRWRALVAIAGFAVLLAVGASAAIGLHASGSDGWSGLEPGPKANALIALVVFGAAAVLVAVIRRRRGRRRDGRTAWQRRVDHGS
jgi:hypothetical protein